MESHPSGSGIGQQVASFICAAILLSVIVISLVTCSNTDLVLPGNIPPTLLVTPAATATPFGV